MLSDATRFRRIFAGLCMIAAPLLLFLSDALSERGGTTNAENVALVASRRDLEEWSGTLAILGWVLMVIAVLGFMHLLRHRAVALGNVGATLAILGSFSFAVLAAERWFAVAAAGIPAADRAKALAVLERASSLTDYTLVNTAEVLGALIGFALLAVALWRSRELPRALPVLLSGWLAGSLIGLFTNYLTVILAADALLVVGLGGAGLAVLRQPDAEWERPPERSLNGGRGGGHR